MLPRSLNKERAVLPSHQVAFVGFSAFERSTLESYFRLSAKPVTNTSPAAAPSTGWTLVARWEEADLIVADADLPGATRLVIDEGRVGDALFIGGMAAPAGAVGWLPRPIDALQIRRALDKVMAQRAQRQLEAALPRHERRTQGPSARARQMATHPHHVQDFRASDGFSNSVLLEGEIRLDAVLVISADRIEQKMLRDLLGRLGYQVQAALRGEDALRITRRQGFGFVFLGKGMDGLDPYQTCRQLKRPGHSPNRPVVVLLSERRSAIDRIRATFAGADAFLGEPLLDEELMRVLAQHDSTFERIFEPTAPLAA
jgi:two-component system, cell cycle response regulator